jgi:hypothetical protein
MVRSAPPNPSIVAIANGNSALDVKLQETITNKKQLHHLIFFSSTAVYICNSYPYMFSFIELLRIKQSPAP